MFGLPCYGKHTDRYRYRYSIHSNTVDHILLWSGSYWRNGHSLLRAWSSGGKKSIHHYNLINLSKFNTRSRELIHTNLITMKAKIMLPQIGKFSSLKFFLSGPYKDEK